MDIPFDELISAEVSDVPWCDICKKDGIEKKAAYDAEIPFGKVWAYLCSDHFTHFRCSLGTGKGQVLFTEKSN